MKKLDKLLEKVKRYKYLKCKEKFMKKFFGVNSEDYIDVFTLTTLIRNIIKYENE